MYLMYMQSVLLSQSELILIKIPDILWILYETYYWFLWERLGECSKNFRNNLILAESSGEHVRVNVGDV